VKNVGYVRITIKLPEYLVKWLDAVTKEMGRTPDDFIAEILHRYYDVWKLGREESCG
jgi:metal-responsive CopG/Arc/MetJ family transcriptional regulator